MYIENVIKKGSKTQVENFQGQRSHGRHRNRFNIILKWILGETDYEGQNHTE